VKLLLIGSETPQTFKSNLKSELKAGNPMSQSLAIAYSMKKKAKKKMADGGEVKDSGKQTLGEAIGYPGYPKPSPAPQKMAEGGEVDSEDEKTAIASNRKWEKEHGAPPKTDSEIKETLHNFQKNSWGDSIVHRIMSKAFKEEGEPEEQNFSEGGQVANDTEELADSRPNEFDDLVLRDGLSSDFGDDDNSGDELGNEQEEKDRHDIVARVMRSRAKKDRMPRPA
jgi:hypothetical protein